MVLLMLTRRLIFFTLAALNASSVPAVDVLIVPSDEHRSYTQFAESAALGLSAAALSSKILAPDEVPLGEGELERHRALLAIGSQSAELLNSRRPRAVPLFYALVQHPELLALDTDSTACGIAMGVSPSEDLALFRRMIPTSHELATLYSSKDPASMRRIEEAREILGEAVGLATVDIEAHSSPAEAIRAMIALRSNAIWVAADPVVAQPSVVRGTLLYALRRSIPVFAFSRSIVEAGALAAVVAPPSEQSEQLVELVAKELAGTGVVRGLHPADHRIVINEMVARRLWIPIPRELQDSAEILGRH
ncbi:MAG: hypothetical protein CME06_01840 [Gemmatimonadetes bacterium]|nr:hypothetical protein [Gemmatimonadota bacterium]